MIKKVKKVNDHCIMVDGKLYLSEEYVTNEIEKSYSEGYNSHKKELDAVWTEQEKKDFIS